MLPLSVHLLRSGRNPERASDDQDHDPGGDHHPGGRVQPGVRRLQDLHREGLGARHRQQRQGEADQDQLHLQDNRSGGC